MVLLPLVGLVIGAILVLVRFALAWIGTPDLINGAVLTCVYIFLTGGLHFDGLADTFDGIFSGRTKEQSLEIMKDSRIGVFGTLGIIMAGIFYFALFTGIPIGGLLAFPVCGRACCLISASIASYAREDGMGKAASTQSGSGPIISAAVSIIGVSFLLMPLFFLAYILGGGFFQALDYRYLVLSRILSISDFYALPVTASLIACAAAVFITVLMTREFKKKLGGVTGDTFGAVIEVSSLVYMFAFIVLWGALPL